MRVTPRVPRPLPDTNSNTHVYILQIHEIIHIHCVVNLSSLNIAELLINVQLAKNELFSYQCPVS